MIIATNPIVVGKWRSRSLPEVMGVPDSINGSYGLNRRFTNDYYFVVRHRYWSKRYIALKCYCASQPHLDICGGVGRNGAVGVRPEPDQARRALAGPGAPPRRPRFSQRGRIAKLD